MAAVETPARRGDLVVLVTKVHDYILGQGSVERDNVEIGVVSMVSKDGLARRATVPYGPTSELLFNIEQRRPNQVLLVDKDKIDVQAALKAYREHHWPGHPGQTKPCDSVDEAKNLLRPFLLKGA